MAPSPRAGAARYAGRARTTPSPRTNGSGCGERLCRTRDALGRVRPGREGGKDEVDSPDDEGYEVDDREPVEKARVSGDPLEQGSLAQRLHMDVVQPIELLLLGSCRLPL